MMTVQLSDEQQALLDAIDAGERKVVVNATVGSGKTTAIQRLCKERSEMCDVVLYLTYSHLLKIDAQAKIRERNVKVTNYHGFVYPYLLKHGFDVNQSDSIRIFNENFAKISRRGFPIYDLLVIDEYQDMNSEYARLVENIVSTNPDMQIVVVGDLEQKVQNNSTLDVEEFIHNLNDVDPLYLKFSQSFRIGQELADKLSVGWNKKVVGVNNFQIIEHMSFDDAVTEMCKLDPGQLLVLGGRGGSAVDALNEIERIHPQKFNKNTVYASIKEEDSVPSGTHGSNVAIFTTFDASKGMERDTVFVMDYNQNYWDSRNKHADSDAENLRNVFLVAASRGKSRIIFSGKEKEFLEKSDDSISGIELSIFSQAKRNKNARDFSQTELSPSDAFSHKIYEHVQNCLKFIKKSCVQNAGQEIELSASDGFIDLSPAIGMYATELYFNSYQYKKIILDLSARGRRNKDRSLIPIRHRGDEIIRKSKNSSDKLWSQILTTVAMENKQIRYVDQVDYKVPLEVQKQIANRLEEHFPDGARSEVGIRDHFWIKSSKHNADTWLHFTGRMDAVLDDTVWEFKFTSELAPEHFLQLALYMTMSGLERGRLFNIRTNEMWEVSIPNKRSFTEAVIQCVTMGQYDTLVH